MIRLCATILFSISSCFYPRSRRRAFPPAAPAITSDVAQPGESFQAKSSQTAGAQLKRQQLHQLRLWGCSAARGLTRSLNIAHATPGYKRRNTACFGVLQCIYDLGMAFFFFNRQLQAERADLNMLTYAAAQCKKHSTSLKYTLLTGTVGLGGDTNTVHKTFWPSETPK